jgi:lipopolysaccharide export LptBFGC system permease protein LptF
MKTLDRYIVKTFLSSVLAVFISLLMLRVVLDMFINMDEFASSGEGVGGAIYAIVSYYGYQVFCYVMELGGIIIVLSAVFTIWRMNRTNELTAMLASGISLHRVVWPIVGLSILLGGVLLIDQEIIIPRIASKLIRDRDATEETDTEDRFAVELLLDSNRTVWYSPVLDQSEGTMLMPRYTVRTRGQTLNPKSYGAVFSHGVAVVAPAEEFGTFGWLMTEASLHRAEPSLIYEVEPNTSRIHTRLDGERIVELVLEYVARVAPDRLPEEGFPSIEPLSPQFGLHDDSYDMDLTADQLILPVIPEPGPDGIVPRVTGDDATYVLVEPRFSYYVDAPDGRRLLGVIVADRAVWTESDVFNYWRLENGAIYYPTDLDPEGMALQRARQYYRYMSTRQLGQLLDSGKAINPHRVQLTKNIRIADPVNNIVMLLLGLPFILSRERNLKASALLCVMMVGAFFAFIYICRFLMPEQPFWAAYMPILLFGPVAAVMLDAIKT